MNPEKVKAKTVYPEFDGDSYKGDILPYGCDRTDDLDILLDNRRLDMKKENKSTVFMDTTGDPVPENA